MALVDYLSLSVVISTSSEPDAVYKVKDNRDSRTQCALIYAWLGERIVAYYYSYDVDVYNKPLKINTMSRKAFEKELIKHKWEKLN